jgi:hypothetical protein
MCGASGSRRAAEAVAGLGGHGQGGPCSRGVKRNSGGECFARWEPTHSALQTLKLEHVAAQARLAEMAAAHELALQGVEQKMAALHGQLRVCRAHPSHSANLFDCSGAGERRYNGSHARREEVPRCVPLRTAAASSCARMRVHTESELERTGKSMQNIDAVRAAASTC